jgi:PAS domain S-box-containing protein
MPTSERPLPLRILIIDDCPEDRELYRRLLGDDLVQGYEFVETTSGEEGLTLCSAQRPDCVLLDYRLPDLEGMDVLASLRSVDGFVPVPVVMLTAFGDDSLDEQAMRAGAQDYLAKSQVTGVLLRRAIRHAIERHRQQATFREIEKGAQQAIESSELRYRRLFETAKDGIFILDADSGAITDVNPFLTDLLGYTPEELLGKRLWEVSPLKDIAANQDAFRKLQETEYVRYEHLPLQTQHGSRVDVEFVSNVYRAGGKRIIQCNVRDISARKEIEQLRADFLAMLTHDIKNPLAVIYGYVDLLREVGLSPDAEELVARIGDSAQTVLSLVTNYLDLSKIELGRLTLTRRPVLLPVLFEGLVKAHETEATRRRVALVVQFDPTLPRVDGDPLALERIFANLLHNAFKFTPDGGRITISAGPDQGRVAVAVTNTGPGIAPDEIPSLFQRYQQTATGRATRGAGMGLFIVKSLTEAHGGTVEVESTPGVETRFVVFLPVATTSPDS